MAQDVEVMVIPLSNHADGDAAPDGSGFVLLASSSQPSRYGVVITSDSGISSAEITIGQDGTFTTISQEGDSGYDLDAPVALTRNGNIALAVAPSSLVEYRLRAHLPYRALLPAVGWITTRTGSMELSALDGATPLAA